MVNFLCSGSLYCRADQGPSTVKICPKQRDRRLPTNNLPIIHLLPYQTTTSPSPLPYHKLCFLPTTNLPPNPNTSTKPSPPDAGLLYRVRDPQFQTGPTRQVRRPLLDTGIFTALFFTISHRFHSSDTKKDAIETYLWPSLTEGPEGACVQKGVVIT